MVALQRPDWRALCAARHMPALATIRALPRPRYAGQRLGALSAIVRQPRADPGGVEGQRSPRRADARAAETSYAEFLDQPPCARTGLIQGSPRPASAGRCRASLCPSFFLSFDGKARATSPLPPDTAAILANIAMARPRSQRCALKRVANNACKASRIAFLLKTLHGKPSRRLYTLRYTKS